MSFAGDRKWLGGFLSDKRIIIWTVIMQQPREIFCVGESTKMLCARFIVLNTSLDVSRKEDVAKRSHKMLQI